MHVQGFGLKIAVPFLSGFQLPASRAARERIALKSDLRKLPMAKAFIPFHDADTSLVPDMSRGQLTSAMIGAVRNIRAINDLLVTEHRHNDGFTIEAAEGIYDLILYQTQVLAAVANQVSRWEDEYRAEAMAESAQRSGEVDKVRRVREACIAAEAGAGTEPQVIAQALNMRRSSVERVIGQLRGSDAASGAPRSAQA